MSQRITRSHGRWVAMLVVAGVLGGCTGLHPTPDNGRESCDGVDASYTADRRCVGGSASLDPGLARDVTQGIQSRGLDHVIGR